MININDIIDFNEYSKFDFLYQGNFTDIATCKKISSPSEKYLIKIFNFQSYSSKTQKIVLSTFSEISTKKNQYLQSYKHFSFRSELTTAFAMKYISSRTLEKVLSDPNILKSWNITIIMNCIFAVAEAMNYLHNHLIFHGNLCPSNIIIDEADQFYVCDYGLYPIKKLYIKKSYLFNKDYKDPYMINDEPKFKNDIYSFGILIIHLFFSFIQAKDDTKTKKQETLKEFIQKRNENKYGKFPKFCIDLIPACMNSNLLKRPSFKDIINAFKSGKYDQDDLKISEMYQKFKETIYAHKLANKSDPSALNKVGKMYEKGIFFDKNQEKAMKCFKKAADQGDPEALNNYGVLLQDVNKDESALKLKKSAEYGDVYGMNNYGMALYNGNGVIKDVVSAKEYLKKSADRGYSLAQVNYAFVLLNENNQRQEKISEGLKYLKDAMKQEFHEAYYTYAFLLDEGKNIQKDEKLAMKNFKIAADLGNIEAMLEYANRNLIGKGVPQNKEIALKYYKMADIKGSIVAKNKIQELTSNDQNIEDKVEDQRKIDTDDEDYSCISSPLPSLSFSIFESIEKTQESSSSGNNSQSDNNDNNQENSPSDDDDFSSSDDCYSDSQPPIQITETINISGKIIHLPIQVTNKIKLNSLGKIVYNLSSYHTDKYIYPVGYQIERKYLSIHNPNKLAVYRGTVEKGYDSPIFVVECLDESHMIFKADVPSRPWVEAFSEVENAKQKFGIKKRKFVTESGPKNYGFSAPEIIYLIQNLPNAEKCINYDFKNLFIPGIDEEIEGAQAISFYDERLRIILNEDNLHHKLENIENFKTEQNPQNSTKVEQNKTEENNSVSLEDNMASQFGEIPHSQTIDFNKEPEELIQLGDELRDSDPSNAFKCYKAAADQDYPIAYLKCAEMNPTDKLEYYEKAMEHNIPGSFSKWRKSVLKKVGRLQKGSDKIYYFAQLFEKHNDFSDAAFLYKQAKDKLNLQICYEKAKENIDDIEDGHQQYCLGIVAQKQKEFDLAKILFTKAIEKNVKQAKKHINEIDQKYQKMQQNQYAEEKYLYLEQAIDYYEGRNDKDIDYKVTLTLFKIAKKMGCVEADLYIAEYYKNEFGANLLKKLADDGNKEGQIRYANWLKNGIGVKQDMIKALFYYKLAANQGCAEAEFEYGKELYYRGFSEDDKQKGIFYLKKSAENLFPDAIFLYSKIIEEKNPFDSKKFYEYAVEKGSRLALNEQK